MRYLLSFFCCFYFAKASDSGVLKEIIETNNLHAIVGNAIFLDQPVGFDFALTDGTQTKGFRTFFLDLYKCEETMKDENTKIVNCLDLGRISVRNWDQTIVSTIEDSSLAPLVHFIESELTQKVSPLKIYNKIEGMIGHNWYH